MKFFAILTIIIIVLFVNSLLFSDEITKCIETNNNVSYRLNQNNSSLSLTFNIPPTQTDVDVLVIYVTFPIVPGGEAPGGDALPGFDSNVAASIYNFFNQMSDSTHHVHLRTAGGKMFTAEYPDIHYLECFADDNCEWINTGKLTELNNEILLKVYNDNPNVFINQYDPSEMVDMVFVNVTGNIFPHHSGYASLSSENAPLLADEPYKFNELIGTTQEFWDEKSLEWSLAHEYAHQLGLDHPPNNSARKYYGRYELMYNQGPGGGANPLGVRNLIELGWISCETLEDNILNNPIVIEDVRTSYKCYKLPLTSDLHRDEHLLFANHQGTGFDESYPGTGLLVWHIVEWPGKIWDIESASGKWTGDTPDPIYGTDIFDDNSFANYKGSAENFFSGYLSGGKYESITPTTNPSSNSYSGNTRTSPESIISHKAILNISRIPPDRILVDIVQNYWGDTIFSSDAIWEENKSPYYIFGDIVVDPSVVITIEDNTDVIFDTGAELIINGTMNTANVTFSGVAGANITFNSNFNLASGTMTVGDGSTIEFNDDCTIASSAFLNIGSNSTIQLADNKNLTIHGQLIASDITFLGGQGSSITFNSTCIPDSGTNITFGDNLIVDLNQNLTMNTGVNFSFGLNSVVNFHGLTTIYSGSSCMFRDYATVRFFDDFHLYGVLDTGNHSNFDFDDLAHFHQYCYKVPRYYTHINYHGSVIVEGNHGGDEGSIDSFNAPVLFLAGAHYSLGADAIASFADICVIDSAATFYIDHGNASFSDSLLVYGQLWIDNCTMDFGNDTTKAQGIIFEGGGASLSRITDSIVRDCVDGITIINSSPLIKTSEFFNMEKRGFNIIGIDAEPEIRQCYIHSTGTYPLQMLSESDPTLVDNRFYGIGKTGARIWGADGVFSRNEFRSQTESGVFMFSSSAAPQFYSFADSGGNMFDMSHIATQAVFIGGGNPLLGDYPNITGNNIFKNRGSRYYIYNDTPGNIVAELSWWANGTGTGSYYNADGGNVDFSPKLDVEPPAGPLLLKAAVSPFNSGFEKYRQKDYAGAMQDLKQMLQQDKTSVKADQAVFRLGKAARKIGKLGELEAFLGDLKKEKDPQIQYHSRNWLCYLYASRNDMKKAEKLLDEVPKGSSYERTMLLDICSYYASLKDMKNANRIAEMLKERHNNEVLAMELEAALEGWIDFNQVKGQTKARRRGASIPVPQPYIAEQTETPVPVDTVAFKAGIYPNPFNSSTTINFNVEQAGPVQIAIYDLLGRRVQTLVDERRSAGSYRAVWNGCDNTGRSVASGIYFVRMQVGGKAQSFKISYVK